MLSDRIPRRMLLAGFMGLAGCGFAPVYGSGGGYRGRIAFATDTTVAGFRLAEQLEKRLGHSSAPDYRLSVSIVITERDAAITEDGNTDRLNLIGMTSWTLSDIATGATVGSGRAEAFTSFFASGSTIATQSSRDDAEARLSVILADMITSRLLVLASGQDT